MNNATRKELEFRITATWYDTDKDSGPYEGKVIWNGEPTELIQLLMSAMKGSPEIKNCIKAAAIGFEFVDKTFGGL